MFSPRQAPPRPLGAERAGYFSQDTIAALATSVGGALTVLRVSGPRAHALAQQLSEGHEFPPRVLTRARLIQPDTRRSLDDALVAHFPGPNSYTGEDVVEFQLHGGTQVATSVLETLLSLGARQALPGEFSFRAVRNGKLTLNQAQAVADLISASGSGAVELALEKLSGAQNQWLSQLGEDLRRLAMLAEAGIDFSDQDLAEVSLPRLREQLAKPLQQLEQLQRSFSRGERLQNGIRTAFIGVPNAGKSSLFNALLGEDRSIVSPEAGTTRDTVHELIVLNGSSDRFTLRLEDTAGLRAHVGAIEAQGIQRTLKALSTADLVIVVVDANQPSIPSFEALTRHPRMVQAWTQVDRLTEEQRLALPQAVQRLGLSGAWVACSSRTEEGIPELIREIERICRDWITRPAGDLLLTRIEHLRAVEIAQEHLQRALGAGEPALLASDLRQALSSLAPLIGETVPDDILGLIFSEFCIGK